MAHYAGGPIDPSLNPDSTWNAFEDSQLVILIRQHVTEHGDGWDKVSSSMGSGRSAMECSERWGMLESGTSRKGVLRKTRPGRPRESDLLPPMDDGQGGIQMMYGLEEMRHEADIAVGTNGLELDYEIAAPVEDALPAFRKTSGVGDGIKRPWSPLQDANLLAYVAANGNANWARVAAALGGGRSAASCTARWCRLSGTKSTGDGEAAQGSELNSHEMAYEAKKKGKRQKYQKWTKPEDDELHALVLLHGPKSWSLIASAMSTERTDDSCCGRWTHYLAPAAVPEGEDAPAKLNSNATNPRWTPQQDAVLTGLKQELPALSWSKIGSSMDPPRSAGSCRARWVQHVAPSEDVEVAAPVLIEAPQVLNGIVAYHGQPHASSSDAHQSLYGLDEAFNAAGLVGYLDPVLMEGMGLLPTVPGLGLGEYEQHVHEDHQVDFDPIVVSMDKGKGKERAHGTPGSHEEDHTPKDSVSSASKNKSSSALKNNWTEGEEKRLLSIVKSRGPKHAWGSITEELGTGRTSASASARWHKLTSMKGEGGGAGAEKVEDGSGATPKKKAASRPWNDDDDNELRANIKKYGKNDWHRVGAEMSFPRSQHAASSRWYEQLTKRKVEPQETVDGAGAEGAEAEPILSVKNRWSLSEDSELRALVNIHGTSKWTTVGSEMSTGRSGTSCRLRYINYLENTHIVAANEEPLPTSLPDAHFQHHALNLSLGGYEDDEGASFEKLLALASSGGMSGQGKRGREGEEGDLEVGKKARYD